MQNTRLVLPVVVHKSKRRFGYLRIGRSARLDSKSNNMIITHANCSRDGLISVYSDEGLLYSGNPDYVSPPRFAQQCCLLLEHNSVVVVFDPYPGIHWQRPLSNIVCVSSAGTRLWIADWPSHMVGYMGYNTTVSIRGGDVFAYHLDGWECQLDGATGKIKHQRWVK